MSCSIIYFHWEAMLLSFLLVEKFNLPFTDFQTLLDNTNYRIGVTTGSYSEDIFKYSPFEIYKKAYDTRIKPYLNEYGKKSLFGLLESEDIAIYEIEGHIE